MKTTNIVSYNKKLGYIDNPNDGYNPSRIVDNLIQKKTKQFFTDPNYQKR
jgi:hypothetical protein